MKTVLLAVLVVVALAGCSTQRFNIGGKLTIQLLQVKPKCIAFSLAVLDKLKLLMQLQFVVLQIKSYQSKLTKFC